MHPDLILGILALLWGIALPLGLGIALYRSERRVRDLLTRLSGHGAPADDRVNQLEQNYEALAKQMNQLAAGQQFLSRLIGKKTGRQSSTPNPAFESTPH